MASGILLALLAAYALGHAIWGDWGRKAWEAIT